MGRRELGHQGQRRRPGLLRLDAQTIRVLGTRLHQGRLHQRPSLPPHRDRPDRARPSSKTGRPILLSLSPGPTSLDHAAEVAEYAQMWRIRDDHWDVWTAEHKPSAGEFPFGTRDAFDRLARWALVGPGSWPDEDMLPFGWLGPHPGWGEARQSRFTPDEEKTEFTLWAVARSPLIFGANLTRLDAYTRSLITNQDLLFIDQNSIRSTPIPVAQKDGQPVPWRAWVAIPARRKKRPTSPSSTSATAKAPGIIPWTSFQLPARPHAAVDIFTQAQIPARPFPPRPNPPHGSVVFRVE